MSTKPFPGDGALPGGALLGQSSVQKADRVTTDDAVGRKVVRLLEVDHRGLGRRAEGPVGPTRCEPEADIDILRRCWSGPLDPVIHPTKKGFNSRAIIDATRPYEWIKDFPPVAESSKEVLDATAKKWGAELFGNGKK